MASSISQRMDLTNAAAAPIANAMDDIFVVRQGAWHVFPDFVNGVPATDARFRSSRGPAPTDLLARHPKLQPPLLSEPAHSGIAKFDFSRSGKLGFAGEMF